MTARETYITDLDEQSDRDFVLKQPSTAGPWVALGLGLTVLVFLGALLHVNFIAAPLSGRTSAQTGREEGAALPAAHVKGGTQRAVERRQPTATVGSQGRMINALLGGQGPALVPANGTRVPTSSAFPRRAPPSITGRP